MTAPLPTPGHLVPRTRTVQIVCHRGANEYAPANTFAAAQICVDWGMDYVEIDVNSSRDGVLYVFHGPELEYTTDGAGLFHAHTAAEIDRLDAGSWFDARFRGERVPRLDAFLRWIKGKAKLFFDVKRADLPQLIALVTELELEDDCFFWFGDDADALAFHRLAPHLALKLNAQDAADVRTAYERYGARLIEVEPAALSPALVTACRARGLELMVYTQDKDPAALAEILRWDVQLINCDHGDLVAQVAAAHAARPKPDAGSPPRRVAAILLDCGDTLVDEGTEVKPDGETSVQAELIPGAAELVRELKRRGYPLGLVADGPVATFENNLGPYGLYELFDAYAISAVVGVAKPAAAMFQRALDRLGILPADYGRVLMVGNHLGRDIRGANALGLTSVWLDWAPRRAKTPADPAEAPAYTIRTPLELLELLDRLEAG